MEVFVIVNRLAVETESLFAVIIVISVIRVYRLGDR